MKLLIKARGRLVPRWIVLTHPDTGTTYRKKIWVLPEEAKSAAPKAMQGDLFSAAAELRAVKPLTDDKQIAAAISSAAPENRSTVQAALFGNAPEKAVRTPFSFTPSDINTKSQSLHVPSLLDSYLDYRAMPESEIYLFNKKTILDTERPTWIPEIPIRNFAKKGWWLPIQPHEDGTYTLSWYGEPIRGLDIPGAYSSKKYAARMSLSLIVATIDYYTKRHAAEDAVKYDKMDRELQEGYERRIQDLKSEYTADQIAADPKLTAKLKWLEARKNSRYKRTRATMLGENRMTQDQARHLSDAPISMYERVGAGVWDRYRALRNSLRQKADDMEIQQEEWESSFGKGRETAYGDKGTKDDLLNSHGVLVKRQNGDEITSEEVGFIRATLDKVWEAFGDRSSMARKFGLKISHAGDVLMHARQAVGIFFPYYRAIGVSQKHGKQQFGFTMAHEWAHFMDNYLGRESKRHYASDDYNSIPGRIASTFRDKMVEPQKSKYQNRTCECFARAFEQYFATKAGEAADYQREVNKQGNHPDQPTFEREVAPLIERFFQDHNELLKSLRIPVVRLR